ncbi:MAG: hypothetical protein SGJ18_08035 [Pseudomonadota bacterium]|nr:hypothetical protein [Pseudomonadota bacterium]
MIYLLALTLIASASIDISKENDKSPYKSLWTIKEGIDTPESVFFDIGSNAIFISNVAGKPDEKDGNGFILKADKNGKVINPQWITGLNAPKGMRSHKGILWVTDIDQVVKINIAEQKIETTIAINGAKFLNDLAIDNQGRIYVSDTLTSRIYRIENDKVSVFIEGKNLESPNGLLVLGNQLVAAAWGFTQDWSGKNVGNLYSIGLTSKRITKITQKPLGNLDGLEVDNAGNYLVSDWVSGKIFRVRPNGKVDVLLHGFKGSADIAYVSAAKLLIVPRMQENMVSGYSLGRYPGY